MTVYNHYKFKHQDDGTVCTVSFEAESGNTVIDNFVSFLAGCGFSYDFIYGYMSEIAEQHFDIEKIKEGLRDERGRIKCSPTGDLRLDNLS